MKIKISKSEWTKLAQDSSGPWINDPQAVRDFAQSSAQFLEDYANGSSHEGKQVYDIVTFSRHRSPRLKVLYSELVRQMHEFAKQLRSDIR
jgi:hypothetical protein